MKFTLWWRLQLTWPWRPLEDFESAEEAIRIGKLSKRPGDYAVTEKPERPYHSAKADWTVAEPVKPRKRSHKPTPPTHYVVPTVRSPESHRHP